MYLLDYEVKRKSLFLLSTHLRSAKNNLKIPDLAPEDQFKVLGCNKNIENPNTHQKDEYPAHS